MAPRELWNSWSGRRAERLTIWLLLAGAATLPLQSTATFDVGFTVRLAHVFAGLALVVGLPFAVRGFLLVSPWLRWSTAGLLATYVAVTATSDLATIAGTPRGGSIRALVYLSDLVVGAGLLALVPGLWRGLRSVQPLLLACTAGAAVAALYANYQWLAQRYNLPLTDILTTRDSNAVTVGADQGSGLLGWERARGTFLEPHFLGSFMAMAAPLAVLTGAQAYGRVRGLAFAAAAAMVCALVVSSSAPSYAAFGIGVIAALAAWSTASGRPFLAAGAASGVAAVIVAAPIVVAAPDVVAGITGRDAVALTATTDYRLEAWNGALDLWAAEPAAGYGAGQSSVRISLVTQGERVEGLNSAHGLWASSLLDVGIVGLGFWLALLSAVLACAFRGVWRGPSLASAMLAAATLAALASALVANDRLDLRVWLIFGIVAASSLAADGRVGPRASLGGVPPASRHRRLRAR